jgi:molecular chaperone GrpE (heat shock protein)
LYAFQCLTSSQVETPWQNLVIILQHCKHATKTNSNTTATKKEFEKGLKQIMENLQEILSKNIIEDGKRQNQNLYKKLPI